MTIEERFYESYQRVKKRGYTPHRFLEMVAEHGHVKTVKILLVPSGRTTGRVFTGRSTIWVCQRSQSSTSLTLSFLSISPRKSLQKRAAVWLIARSLKDVKTMRAGNQHEPIEA
jgi:hypothetical protein